MKKQIPSIKQEKTPEKETFYIKITEDGPYMVFGHPPIGEEIIVPNSDGASWSYQTGKTFDCHEEPTCLCRCGTSRHAPFCDGNHVNAEWDPTETASKRLILDDAEEFEGPMMVLADNVKYCAFARFCDAGGRIWNIIQEATTNEERALAHHEVGYCPSGRLLLWDKEEEKLYEPDYKPSIGILEDPGIKVSGPIWVKGGIRIEGANGESYEIRNRVTLCRCGQSSNKPFCNGTHASIHFHAGLKNNHQ